MHHNIPRRVESHSDQPNYNESHGFSIEQVFWFGISVHGGDNFVENINIGQKNMDYLSKVVESLNKQD